jgi:hypothetical protein
VFGSSTEASAPLPELVDQGRLIVPRVGDGDLGGGRRSLSSAARPEIVCPSFGCEVRRLKAAPATPRGRHWYRQGIKTRVGVKTASGDRPAGCPSASPPQLRGERPACADRELGDDVTDELETAAHPNTPGWARRSDSGNNRPLSIPCRDRLGLAHGSARSRRGGHREQRVCRERPGDGESWHSPMRSATLKP